MTFGRELLILAFVFAGLPCANAQATPEQRRGIVFGTFSSLQYIEEAGDVLGYEITIIPQYRSAYAIFQCAEGAPSDPVFVPITISSKGISFTINGSPLCDGTYKATVTAKGLRLTSKSLLDGYGFLARRSSYWSPK